VALSAYLHNFIVDHGSNPKDQCVWITLSMEDRLDFMQFMLLTSVQSKGDFGIGWLHLSKLNSGLLGKNFNMVEWEGDCCGSTSSMVSDYEKQAWSCCKVALQIFC
jgi:hypothetical protein